MRAKHGYAGTVLLVLLAGPSVQAQGPMNLPPLNDTAPIRLPADAPALTLPPTGKPLATPLTTPPLSAATSAGPDTTPPTSPGTIYPSAPAGVQAVAPDAWIYQQPQQPAQPSPVVASCCGPTGRNGSIGTEVNIQTGPSFVLSNSAFGKSLHTGYSVGGTGRSLFFNREGTRDWNILLDLNWTLNDGIPTHDFVNLNGNGVTIRNLERTAVGLGLGYDWFLLGAGNVGVANGTNLSTGFDGGARWGSSHLDMNILGTNNTGYSRIQHVYGEGFAGWRTNLEVPMSGWTWLTGIRSEYSYSSLHLLPNHQNTGLHNLNLVITTGVRY